MTVTETWQVYGLGGESLAEYAANTSASSPQKEYGYRNGQLLVTATIGTGWGSPPTYTPPDPLVAGVEIKLEHLTELRTAVNQLRVRAGLAAVTTWNPDPDPHRNETYVHHNHIQQLRTKLEEALTALHLPIGGYAHSGPNPGDPIYAIDFQELRDKITAAWSSVQVNWLVSDQLGTPRMIFDQSGSLATVGRHDYLPFGAEVGAGIGGRTTMLATMPRRRGVSQASILQDRAFGSINRRVGTDTHTRSTIHWLTSIRMESGQREFTNSSLIVRCRSCLLLSAKRSRTEVGA